MLDNQFLTVILNSVIHSPLLKDSNMSHLVIVDMQPRFEAANCDNTAENIIRLVKVARKRKWRISVLEYSFQGPTREDIKKAVGKYRKAKYIMKSNDDGSEELAEAWRIKDGEKFLICGVNYTACVARTAIGVQRLRIGTAKIVQDACNQPGSWVNEFWYRPSLNTIRNKIDQVMLADLVS